MFTFIVVGAAATPLREALVAIRGFSDGERVVVQEAGAGSPRRPALCERRIALRFDRAGEQSFIDLANGFCDRMSRTAVIAADLEGTRLLVRVRDRLRIGTMPLPDDALLGLFADRWNFHRFCCRHGLDTPPAILAGGGAGFRFDAVVARADESFVMKPTDIALPCSARMAAGRISLAKVIRMRRAAGAGPIMVQRYIEGEDIGLDLLAVRGRLQAFAIHRRKGGEIRFIAEGRLESVAHRLVEASGYHGVLSVSARREAGSGRIFLLGARPHFGGALSAAAGCGLNFVAESLAAARRNRAVSALTSGAFPRRHPLLRPFAWPGLLSDADPRTRLLRARMRGAFPLPAQAWRHPAWPEKRFH